MNPASVAPVAYGASLRVSEAASVSTTEGGATSLIAHATDVEGDSLTAVLVTAPTRGTL